VASTTKSKKYGNEQIRRFLYFLKTFIHIENAEINVNFDKQISFLTDDQTAMGIIETIKLITREEGREKGIEEGKLVFVKNLLNNTEFDVVKIANLADVSVEFVLKIQGEM
jgi:predicted transposase YdaD